MSATRFGAAVVSLAFAMPVLASDVGSSTRQQPAPVNVATRQEIAGKLAASGLADSLGGRILRYFVDHSPQGQPIIHVVNVQPPEIVRDYSAHQFSLIAPIKEFAGAIGADVVYADAMAEDGSPTLPPGASPPFSDLTLTLTYSGVYYRYFNFSGTESDWVSGPARVRGLRVFTEIALYQPRQMAPERQYSINALPTQTLVNFQRTGPVPNVAGFKVLVADNINNQLDLRLEELLALDEVKSVSH